MTEEFAIDDDQRPIDLDTWRCKGDPIECTWEAKLGQAEEANRRLRAAVASACSDLLYADRAETVRICRALAKASVYHSDEGQS